MTSDRGVVLTLGGLREVRRVRRSDLERASRGQTGLPF